MLRSKPEKVTVNAGQDNNVAVASNAAMLSIPASSVVDGNGNVVTGNVDLYVDFVDGRNRNPLLHTAPGEFSYRSEEGEMVPLLTQGVFGIGAYSPQGEVYKLNGEVTLSLNVNDLGIGTSNGDIESYLWTLNPLTGQWQEPQPLTVESKRRRRRQAVTIVNGTVTVIDAPWVNIDKPIFQGRQCLARVKVYTDNSKNAGAAGVVVRAFTKQGSAYVAQTLDYTDVEGAACVAIPCGYEHEIYAFPDISKTNVSCCVGDIQFFVTLPFINQTYIRIVFLFLF